MMLALTRGLHLGSEPDATGRAFDHQGEEVMVGHDVERQMGLAGHSAPAKAVL